MCMSINKLLFVKQHLNALNFWDNIYPLKSISKYFFLLFSLYLIVNLTLYIVTCTTCVPLYGSVFRNAA